MSGKPAMVKRNFNTYWLLLSIALAASLGTGFWPGGYDALHFYLRPPFPGTTAPGWVYLVTYPLSWLGWPLGWQALTVLNIGLTGLLALRFEHHRWWLVFLSLPLWWTIWLGQIEFLPVMGMLVFLLVLRGRLARWWLGLSWVALLAKPQVGWGLLAYQAYWWLRTSRERPNGKAFIKAVLVSGGIILASVLLWPRWPLDWFHALHTFRATWWNAAIWPYGLLTLPVSLLVLPRLNENARLRVVAAASLLSSPYFALYHCTLLMALTHDVVTIGVSWLPLLLGRGVPAHWMGWGWVLPLWVWGREVGYALARSGWLRGKTTL